MRSGDAHGVSEGAAGGVVGWDGWSAGIGEVVRVVLGFEEVDDMGPEGLIGLTIQELAGYVVPFTVKAAVAFETTMPSPMRALMKRVAVGKSGWLEGMT